MVGANRVEENGNGKHSSFLRYGGNYCRKKFYSRSPEKTTFLLTNCFNVNSDDDGFFFEKYATLEPSSLTER
jgi:hypothetical protein